MFVYICKYGRIAYLISCDLYVYYKLDKSALNRGLKDTFFEAVECPNLLKVILHFDLNQWVKKHLSQHKLEKYNNFELLNNGQVFRKGMCLDLDLVTSVVL